NGRGGRSAEDRRRRARHRADASEIRGDHDPLAAEAVAEQCREGGDDRRGEEPDEPDEADGGRASGAIREYRERHLVAPLADDRAAPGEFELAQILVAKDRGERSKRLVEAPSQGSRHARRIAGRVALLKRGPEDCPAGARLVRGIDFRRGGSVEDDREKLKLAKDEGEDVEAHK